MNAPRLNWKACDLGLEATHNGLTYYAGPNAWQSQTGQCWWTVLRGTKTLAGDRNLHDINAAKRAAEEYARTSTHTT